MPSDIDPELRRFILVSIPSVPYLEALLLLHENADRHWTARDLARRLYLSEDTASRLLIALQEAGIATYNADRGGHYAPLSPELDGMIGRLAKTYAQHLIEVTNLIHSGRDKKAQQFADAFKWRKE